MLRKRAALLVLLALVSIGVIVASQSSHASASVAVASGAEGASAQPTFKVVPASSLPTAAPSTAKSLFFRGGVRSHPSPATSATSTQPIATSSPKVAIVPFSSQPGEYAAHNPNQTPPDSTGAVGPTNYVEMVNSRISVYCLCFDPLSSATLDTFVGAPGTGPYCDPQIQWDPSANRWLFAFLYCNTQTATQFFWVGWSRTPDPVDVSPSAWCHFPVGTGSNLFDYPKLGHNSNYMIVGGNLYDESHPSGNPPFVSAAIAWIPLPANGDTNCPTTVPVGGTTGTLKNGDGVTQTFTPVPVNETTNASDGYVLSAYGTGLPPATKNKLAVWHLDSTGVLHQNADIIVNAYSAPFSAPQAGTSDVLDTLDGRLTQAVGDPTTGIWTQHTVDGPGHRSMVDWYEITVIGSTAVLNQQGAVSSTTDYVFNAAISPESDALGAAVFYDRTSSTTLPVIGAQVRLSTTPVGMMEPGEVILATSTAADTDFSCNVPNPGAPCRWGDYSGASPDPNQPNVVWGTSEFNTAPGSTPAWSDENFAVYVAVAPHSPTAVTSSAGDNSARVVWTASTFDARLPTTNYTITAYTGLTQVGTMTVAGAATAAIFKGLTDGVSYSFTVIANNLAGSSPESQRSNVVTPTRAVQQVPMAPLGSRSGARSGPLGTPGPR
jgi:hypothetical protein